MSEEIKERVIKGKDKELSPADLKKKSLETALAKIEKAYGKGTVINMAARPTTEVDVIPTGSEVILEDVSSRSMVQNPQVRPRWPSMLSPKYRSRAGRP